MDNLVKRIPNAERSAEFAGFMHAAWRRSFGVPPMPRGGVMSGKRVANFRSGDRSEYLAKYGLSRFCFVYDVSRQEDVGLADFFCTLAAEKSIGNRLYVYPEESFYVQIKSDTKPQELDEETLDWISNSIANPFYYCIINKAENKLSLYSCGLIWKALSECKKARRISIALNRVDHPFDREVYQIGNNEDEAEFKVYVGPPILEQTLDQLEADRGFMAYTEMKKHVSIDMANVLYSTLGKVATAHLVNDRVRSIWYELDETQIRAAESSLVVPLIGLFVNYVNSGNNSKALSLLDYLVKLEVDPARLQRIVDSKQHTTDFAAARAARATGETPVSADGGAPPATSGDKPES